MSAFCRLSDALSNGRVELQRQHKSAHYLHQWHSWNAGILNWFKIGRCSKHSNDGLNEQSRQETLMSGGSRRLNKETFNPKLPLLQLFSACSYDTLTALSLFQHTVKHLKLFHKSLSIKLGGGRLMPFYNAWAPVWVGGGFLGRAFEPF